MPKLPFKALLINVVIIFFLGAGISNVYAGSVFLSKRLSIDVKNQTVEQVLHLVETKASVLFMYNPQMFNAKRRLTLQLHASVQEILQHVINNKELVFYEMNNYIVITTKHEAPKQIQYISAALTESAAKSQIVDTVRIYDTIVINDTIRVSVVDTITVYDTIRNIKSPVKEKTAEKTATSKSDAIATVNNRSFFISSDFGPQYSDLLPDAGWLSDMSFAARGAVGCKWDNLSVSVGLGLLWQRGGSLGTKQITTRDSTVISDTAHVMQRYKKGDYWYYNGTDSVQQTIYDSVMIQVPYTWYKTSIHSATIDSSVAHNILWLTIPCRLGYEWMISRKTNVGVSLCASPAFAVQRSGSIYDPKAASYRSINQYGIRLFNVLLALEPSVSYALSKKLSFQIVPVLQLSAISIFTASSAHYVGFGTYLGLRKMF